MKNDERIKGGKLAIIVAGILLFYKIRPYFFWFGIFNNNYFKAIVTIILGLIFFINLKKMSKMDKVLMSIFGIILISYPFVGDQNFNVFVSIAPLIFLPFASDLFTKKTFNCFLNIYCFFVGIALLVWVLSITGLIQPYKIIPPLNEVKDYTYKVYPFLVQDDGLRFCGPFDEPGVIGTVSALFLCCQKDLKNKNSIILLLSGICSLSLFFFLIISFYFAYSQLIVRRSTKAIIGFFVVAFVGILAITASPILSEMILGRLEFDSSTGMFTGDNRTSAYAWEMFDNIKGTRAFWFGIDNKWDFQEQVAFSSSYINVILMNGMFFFLLVVFFYVLYGWVNKRSVTSFLMFVLVFLGVIYQRPGIFNPEYIFLWSFLARKEALLNPKSII